MRKIPFGGLPHILMFAPMRRAGSRAGVGKHSFLSRGYRECCARKCLYGPFHARDNLLHPLEPDW